MGAFKLKSKINLNSLEPGAMLEESDFSTVTPEGNFLQFEYLPEENKVRQPVIVKPGIFSVIKTMAGFVLEPTSFTNDAILEEFVNTKEIENIVDCFFNNLHVYKEEGIEIPKRGVLLYGPAGSGKTTAISKSIRKYSDMTGTFVLVWHTSKYEADDIKDFIKSFQYNGVERMILVCEDLGGLENEQTRMRSDSSLLALLDNQEKTFTLPTMIIATTNYAENFAENLTNRPGRFDDKLKVGYLDGEARKALLKFFTKSRATEQELTLIGSKECEKFLPAHIREVNLRSRLRSETIEKTIKKILEEIKLYNKAFDDKSRSIGL